MEIEILSIKPELYPSIESACKSLNRVQNEQIFIFKTPPERLKESFYLEKRSNYESKPLFDLLRKYRNTAGGDRRYLMLVVDGPLTGPNLGNLFGSCVAQEGMAVFTVADFSQFINDIIRYCRYYLVRYAVGFLAPNIKSHTEQYRKSCIFHKKIQKIEIRDSLDSGDICEGCYDQLRPLLNQEIDNAIKEMLMLVSNQHPFAVVFKGGGVKGLAFAGALLELEKHFSFDCFAGTSAGAITAVLMGAGYKPSELLEILSNKNFNDFTKSSIIKGIFNFCLTRGYYSGNEIHEWLDELLGLQQPEKLKEVLLNELPTRTIIYATRAKDGILTFDSKGERRETLAAFAARCSMSIPYVFSPQYVDGKRTYDGGAKLNFPLQHFMDTHPQKPVLGMYLINDSKKGGLVIGDLVDIAISGDEIPIVQNNLDKVVVIDPRPIGTTDFNLTGAKKKLLILSGRLGALKFLQRNYKDILVDELEVETISNKINQLRQEV